MKTILSIKSEIKMKNCIQYQLRSLGVLFLCTSLAKSELRILKNYKWKFF